VRDPLHSPGAANVGAAGLSRTVPGGVRWQLGVVVEYNSSTHTSTVRTHAGQPLRDVPQMKPTGGGYDHLESGTNVVVSWDLGFPMIVGCIDFVGPSQAAVSSPSLTGVEGYGDADPTQPTTGGNSYKPPLAPVDMSPGDWAQVGAHGNHVAVLGGGLTLVGSPTAQTRSFGMSGVLQHVARSIEAITDFGVSRIRNEQGRTSFMLRAGSAQATETGMDEQNWTIRLDLGATGDILDFVITEPKGRVLFRLHAGSDGRVQLYGDGGVDVSSGAAGTAETRHDVAGGRRTDVGGADRAAIHGVKETVVDQDRSVQVGGVDTLVVGSDSVRSTVGNAAESVGGDSATVVTGSSTAKVGKAAGLDVGDKASARFGKGMDVSVQGEAQIKASGRAVIDGSKVCIGPNGRHPLPVFDAYLRDHAEFMTHLVSAIGALVPSNPVALASQLALMQKFVVLVAQGFPYESTKAGND
jgi:hypothetical protein